MTNLLDKIKKISGLGRSRGCSAQQLAEAQNALGMVFPGEFKEYVSEYGCIDFGPHEWTGLNVNGYLNVVTATEAEKKVNSSFPAKHFVLEDTNIDARKVIVDERGRVYVLQYEQITPLCDSISAYLDYCLK